MTIRAEVLGGAAWLAIGCFLAYAGRDLGVGTVGDPGSGFLVFWGGLLVCGFALWIVVEGARGDGPALGALWAGTRWPVVAAVVVCLGLYAVLLARIGFLLATTPLLLALLRIVDPVRWQVALPLAIGATLGTWWVVERLLLIQLPRGELDLF